MKVSHSKALLTLLALYLIVIINSPVSAYPSLRYPTKRMLAATGDISLPANNFTIDKGVFEVWYEFSSGNETNSTDSATNSTSNGTDATNSTSNSTSNGTDTTNSTTNSTTNGTTNVTDTTNSTVSSPSNGTDVSNTTAPTNVTADATNSTSNSTSNGTDTTNSTTNGTNTTNSTAPPTYVTFAIKFNHPGEYFAIGFGSNNMINADIWAFELVDGAVVASDRKAFGYYEPPLDTANGGTDNLELLGYEITDTYTLVKVRRAVDTGDSDDAIIQPGSNQLIWAFANSETIEYHRNNKGALKVDLTQ